MYRYFTEMTLTSKWYDVKQPFTGQNSQHLCHAEPPAPHRNIKLLLLFYPFYGLEVNLILFKVNNENQFLSSSPKRKNQQRGNFNMQVLFI